MERLVDTFSLTETSDTVEGLPCNCLHHILQNNLYLQADNKPDKSQNTITALAACTPRGISLEVTLLWLPEKSITLKVFAERSLKEGEWTG